MRWGGNDDSRLSGVWLNLFQVCWEFSFVPSVWMESMVVSVPRKQARGVCEVENFHGVSLSSIVCKVMCMVLNVRLSTEEDLKKD